MNKHTLIIWGRVFEIEVAYDYYEGESILDSQYEACEAFLNQAETLLNGAKASVEKYCLKSNRTEIGSDTIENIFKYVKPKTLFVKRCASGEHKVALLCAYKFQPEDGLAIVFENEHLSDIGTENIIL